MRPFEILALVGLVNLFATGVIFFLLPIASFDERNTNKYLTRKIVEKSYMAQSALINLMALMSAFQ